MCVETFKITVRTVFHHKFLISKLPQSLLNYRMFGILNVNHNWFSFWFNNLFVRKITVCSVFWIWTPYRRRSHVCSYFDYTYVGVSKDSGKDWNNRFILFIPFLCGLTHELSSKLLDICSLESQQLLLFQKPKEELQQVLSMTFKIWLNSLFQCSLGFFIRLWLPWVWYGTTRTRKFWSLLTGSSLKRSSKF